MRLFALGHATHPQWPMALGLVLAQLRARLALPSHAPEPTLGLVYITDHYAPHAQDILDWLGAQLPEVTDWAGTVGVGIAASNVEYFDEPGVAVLLCALPAGSYRVFSGVAPLPVDGANAFHAQAALVHADGGTPDLTELIAELAGRTRTGYLFGGLTSSRSESVQFALSGHGNVRGQGAAGGVFHGGLSGVAFDESVGLVSRVTQGCQPVSAPHRITRADANVVLTLDDEPALDVLLRELSISLEAPRQAMGVLRATLVGLTAPGEESTGRAGSFGADVLVRHIIGLDTVRRGVAVAQPVEAGMRLAFCQRDVAAARADLVRICAEIREELEPQELSLAQAAAGADALVEPPAAWHGMAGAVYVSCAGRGGPHFGSPSAELQIVRRALGDVPLVGFFAGGEIARHHLYGYTGVLTVFKGEAA